MKISFWGKMLNIAPLIFQQFHDKKIEKCQLTKFSQKDITRHPVQKCPLTFGGIQGVQGAWV